MAYEDEEIGSGLGDIEATLLERMRKRKQLGDDVEAAKANPFADVLLGLGGGLIAGAQGQNGMQGAQSLINAYQKGATGAAQRRLAALDKEGNDIKLLADLAKARQTGGLGKERLSQQFELQQLKNELQSSREEAKRTEKRHGEVEKASERAGKALEPVDAMLAGVGDVEAILKESKVDLDTYKPGQSVDLPGMSVPFYGRATGYDTKARSLQNTFDGVFNTLLKERSGAAVTDQELKRLANEFSQGKFNTEEEMVGAMQRLKKALIRQRGRTEGRYDKEVVSQLRGRQEAATPQLPGQMEAPAQAPTPEMLRNAPMGARLPLPGGGFIQKGANGKWRPVQ